MDGGRRSGAPPGTPLTVPEPPPPAADDPLRQREARAYARGSRRLEAVGTALSLVLGVAGALAGAWVARVLATPGPLVVDVLAWLLGVGAVVTIAGVPLRVVRYRRSRRVGLSRQGVRSWLLDQAKGAALGLALAWPALCVLVLLQRDLPTWWWLVAALGAVAVEVVLAALAPVLILPLFLRSRPLDPGPLADDLLGLARRAGVRVTALRVLEAGVKTSAANAFVAGLGPTRRIMLFDTLLGEDADAERMREARAVLAHELGHHRAGDVWRFVALGAVTTVVSFGVAAWVLDRLPSALVHGGPGTLAALPALALVLGVIGAPFDVLSRAYSRRRERAADRFAVRVGGDGEAFARALERLCRTNLAELEPPPLYVALRMSHPPPASRIAAARGKETAPGRRTAIA